MVALDVTPYSAGPTRWLTSERLRVYPRIFIACYLLVGAAWLLTADGYIDINGNPLGTDFLNQYAASVLVQRGDAAASYDIPAHGALEKDIIGADDFGYYGWHYPPVGFFFVHWFASLSYGWALVAWMLLTGALYCIAIYRILPRSETFLCALAYPAVMINIGHGHNGFLSTFLLAMALLSLQARRQWLAGVLIGLLIYKPQFGVLIPLALIAGRYWIAFVSAAVTAVLFMLASVVVYGTDAWAAFFVSNDFTRTVILEQGATGWYKIQSVFSLVRGLGGSLALAYSAQLATGIAAATVVVLLWRASVPFALKASALALGSLLATPYLLDYDLVIAAIALTFLVAYQLQNATRPPLYFVALLALAWIWPLFARLIAMATTVQWTPFLLIALTYLTLKLARDSAPEPVAAGAQS